MIYVGDGKHIIGIPARDMSQEEWDSLGQEKQDLLLSQGIMVSDVGNEELEELESVLEIEINEDVEVDELEEELEEEEYE
jgi:hypothetical protein